MGDVTPIRPEPEAYVNRAELAHLLGVSESTVKAWVKRGCPSETWGLRARRFLPSQVKAWARGRRAA